MLKLCLIVLMLISPAVAQERIFEPDGSVNDPAFFPIAVWQQSPSNAKKYKAAGINLYVGLWKGPTEAQLKELSDAGMPVICDQNDVGLANVENLIIAAWMHGDEPDNAQPTDDGYGPPIAPEKIVADYKAIREKDPSRPVVLNLGMGVAFDGWIGRGVRTNHPEDYAQYVQGCDIASFDIYPVAAGRKEIQGKLELVPYGVKRLKQWAGDRPVWSCIECTHIGTPNHKATPQQVRSEVWMALIRGAKGLIYFVHEFKPAFNEHALLDDPEMLKAVTAINAQIKTLAPVLNSPTLDGMTVDTAGDIAVMMKQHEGRTYVFAANLKNAPADATFKLQGAAGDVKVLEESRTVSAEGGAFKDAFEPYAVHLYELSSK